MNKLLAVLSVCLVFVSCKAISTKEIRKVINDNFSTNELTEREVAAGLKEALSIGSERTVNLTSATDGFWKNPTIKIPYPQKFYDIKGKLESIGLKKQVDEFHYTMNKAAEKASIKALPIFKDAVTKMSIKDAFDILRGTDSSATEYFKKTTYSNLYNEFIPVVRGTMNSTNLTQTYNQLVDSYNKIPLVKKFEFSIDEYICNKALDGLFTLLKNEERKIRKDPVARTTELLKKVFSQQ